MRKRTQNLRWQLKSGINQSLKTSLHLSFCDSMEFKIQLTKKDKIGIAILISVVILLAIPVYYRPNPDCEVARPAYKCESAKNVMIEHCEYWGKFNCDTSADTSLPQVEWYIKNLCEIHNKGNHPEDFDCSNLKHACNQATGKQTCPILG